MKALRTAYVWHIERPMYGTLEGESGALLQAPVRAMVCA
jgi:hypothetical protein